MTKVQTQVVRLSKLQLKALIDRNARIRLGISGLEFRRRLAAGTLSSEECPCCQSPAIHNIAMLVRLLSGSTTKGRLARYKRNEDR